jgi:hypothetical protein
LGGFISSEQRQDNMRKKVLLSIGIVTGIPMLLYSSKIAISAIANYPDDTKNIQIFLELISFASSPLILIVAFLGLRQLYFAQKQIDVAKDIFRKQSIRESFQISTNECRNFSEKIVPIIVKIEKFVKDNNITVFDDAKIIHGENGFKVDLTNVKEEQVVKFNEIKDELRDYLNGMELFALPFVSKIADANIGFLTMGAAFVEEAERMAVILPFIGATHDDYKAVYPVYFSWKARLEKMRLEKEKLEIEAKLKTIKYEAKKAIGAE